MTIIVGLCTHLETRVINQERSLRLPWAAARRAWPKCPFTTPLPNAKSKFVRSSPVRIPMSAGRRYTTCSTSETPGHSSHLTSWRGICQARGYRVKFVRNITDVDDKIIARSPRGAAKTQSVRRALDGRISPRLRFAGLPAVGCRATRHRTHRRDDRPHRKADRSWARLRVRRQRLLFRRQLCCLRGTVTAAAGRTAVRCAQRHRTWQARCC